MTGLRSAGAEDAAGIAALVRAAFTGLDLDPPPSALRETAESVAAHLAAGGGMVAERGGTRDGTLAGSMLWVERDGGLYLHRLAVHPSHRRHGIARRLVEAAEAEARRRSLPRLHLAVRLALPGNRKLFAACGFTETALHSHEGYPHPTWVEAEKLLSR